ncbi:glutamine amidotransferase [Candidatus Rariloculus sp.]|uniref:glutamine amidotransferase n=1 Tax=Candidatus Rariloculus sp. TaxID=3101265 RepID=UPI003D1348AD
MFELFFKYSRRTFEQGELLFASGWPLWLLAMLVLLGVAVIAFTLYRNRQDLGLGKLIALGALQTLIWAIALTLLWRPALLSQTLRPQENAVALLVDTSASMSYGNGEQSRLQEAMLALNERALPALRADFEIDAFAFSDQTLALESLDLLPAPGPMTRIGDAVLTVLRGANAGALGALVLISDGADNSGDLDAVRIAEIAGFGVPVHTLGVGREDLDDDIELEDVILPAQGIPGSTVGAQVSIRHGSASQAQLKVYDGDSIIASEQIDLPPQAGVTTRWIDIDVGDAGVRDLRFSVDAIGDEPNLVNNTQIRPLEVPERRRRILYVEGEPRWEYKFIRRALDEDAPVGLATLLRTTPNKFYRQGVDSAEELADGLPSDERTLFAYDALIIGSYEASVLSPEQQEMIRDFVSRRGGSLLMLGGRRGLADGGWGASPVAEVLPAQLPEIDAPSFFRYPAKAVLTNEGELSLLTRLDADDAVNRRLWEELPELADFQYVSDLKPGAAVLLEAEIQGSTEPLLIHHRFGLGNAYIFASGGTWRWQMQLPHEDQRHETFWRQLLQALAASAPEPVMLSTQQVFYADQTTVSLRAEVRDPEFRPAGDATVTVSIDDALNPAVSAEMTPVPGEPGVYELNYEAERPGIYRFEATAELDGEVLGDARVAIRREDGIAEHFRIQQDRALLERLADATGGRYFRLDDVDELPEAVQFSEAGIVERQILDLWNMPVNFLLLLLLKAGEWLFRLRWGRL